MSDKSPYLKNLAEVSELRRTHRVALELGNQEEAGRIWAAIYDGLEDDRFFPTPFENVVIAHALDCDPHALWTGRRRVGRFNEARAAKFLRSFPDSHDGTLFLSRW